MQHSPAFQDVERFVRGFAALRHNQLVSPQTRLEADLGITGDDGDELLQSASKHFGAELAHPIRGYRDIFSLATDEYLFHSEGFDLIGVGALVRWLWNEPRPRVRDLTMGELHNAIVQTIVGTPPPNKSLERTREG
jgi:hypothetical protein